MTQEIKRVDYTTKDYYGYREDMISLIPRKLPEWTDRSPNDPGIVILELLAYQLEKESYYNDRVANETFLSTATQRKSVIEHCKKIGYELAWHTASKYWQVVEIVPQPEAVVIPKGQLFGTKASVGEDSILFEALEDLIIPANQTGAEQDLDGNYLFVVEVEQGQTITDEYLGTIQNEDPSPQFIFTYSPILKDSIVIYVEDHTGKRTWQKVSDFISSDQTSEHYTVEMDEYDKVTISFGTGSSGKLPPIGANIYATYKVGGGVIGNVGPTTIIETYDSIDGFVQTFNPYGPHFIASDKESLEDAKRKGPASLKRLERYVTIDDYEKGVLLDVGGVAKAKAVNVEGDVYLYILPKYAEVMSTQIRDEITEIIEEKKVIFTRVALLDPVYIDFDLRVNLLIYDNYDSDQIKFTAENVLRDMYDVENVNFGDGVKIAHIYHKLIAIEGVRNAILTLPTEDIAGTDVTIPRLGSVEVTVQGT